MFVSSFGVRQTLAFFPGLYASYYAILVVHQSEVDFGPKRVDKTFNHPMINAKNVHFAVASPNKKKITVRTDQRFFFQLPCLDDL